ncbi:MAG: hypothetical protein M5U25_04250 [Planctomycetota bacterium]|nr:hypothetical protein [Planctomycetota bacterium]
MTESVHKQCSVVWYAWGGLFGAGILALLLGLWLQEPSFAWRWIHNASINQTLARWDAEELFERARMRIAEAQASGSDAPARISDPRSSGGLNLKRDELEGDDYVLADVVVALPDGRYRVVAVPRNGHYPVLHCTFTTPDDYEITEAQPAGYQGE